MTLRDWPMCDDQAPLIEAEIADMQARFELLEIDCTKISQALKAKPYTHEATDRRWWSRARSALRIKRSEQRKLAEAIAAARRQLRRMRADVFHDCLITAIQTRVGMREFEAIWNEAHERFNRSTRGVPEAPAVPQSESGGSPGPRSE